MTKGYFKRHWQFQSTHPRGVRPYEELRQIFIDAVSIHAPARGATLNRVRRYNDNFLFQSTHPRGVRLVGAQFGVIDVRVSIHAPARGATRQPRLLQRIRRSFNPRTREGCDITSRVLIGSSFRFQSTHPRGVRRCGTSTTCLHRAGFNPRTREGCDYNYDPLYRPNYCFNPRTREGCDLNFGRSRANCSTFQSTHPRGVRQSG